MITKSHNHHHFWTENNVVYESYNTLRGMRFRYIVILDFDYPDKDTLTELEINSLNSKNLEKSTF